MTGIMVDIETLGTSMDSQILTIGAIAFDLKTFNTIEEFYKRIDLKSCEDLGLRKSAVTVRFWESQPKTAKDEAFNPNRVSIRDAMNDFITFWNRNKGDEFWCNGANFDEPIISTVFERLGLEKPWKFWNVRCLRTYIDIVGLSMKDFGFTAHHALADCKNQVLAYKKATDVLSKYMS